MQSLFFSICRLGFFQRRLNQKSNLGEKIWLKVLPLSSLHQNTSSPNVEFVFIFVSFWNSGPNFSSTRGLIFSIKVSFEYFAFLENYLIEKSNFVFLGLDFWLYRKFRKSCYFLFLTREVLFSSTTSVNALMKVWMKIPLFVEEF